MNTTLKNRTRLTLLAAIGLAAFFTSPAIHAASGDWAADASGNWSDATNWLPVAIPGIAAGDVVGLTFDITGVSTVTLDTTNRTVGILNIGDTNSPFFAYTLAASGGASLAFDTTSGNAQLNKSAAANSAADLISAPLVLNTNLDLANSSAAAGTITIAGSVFAGNTGTKTLANLGAGSAGITISGVIGNGSGTMAVLQNSSGSMLTLSGSNTYSGATTINNGVLKLQGPAFSTSNRAYSIASSGVLNLDGNTAVATNTTTINGAGTLRITGGQLSNGASPGRNIALSMSAGGLIDVQSGASLLNGGWQNINWTNNRAGLTVNGTFDVWDGQNVFVDALNGSGTIDRNIGGGTVILNVGVTNGSGIFSGTIKNTSNVVTFAKSGTGTQTLTGTNSFSGPTTISLGTLDVAGSGSLGLGNYAGAITNNGVLSYSSSSNQTLSGRISGTGSLIKTNTSTLTLTGTNTYSGTTMISAGTLQIGAGTNNGTLGFGSVTNNAALVFNRSDLFLMTNFISGIGSVTDAGTPANTLDVGGANTYSGGTFINVGGLRLRMDLGGRLGSGAVTVASGANLEIWAPSAQTNANAIVLNGATGVSGRPALNWDGGAGKVTLTGTITLNATSDIGVGGTSSNDMDVQGQVGGVGGLIVDARGLSAGNRVLTLTGTNTYTGPTTVKGGTLTIAGGGSLGSGNYDGAITNNAAFVYSSSSNQTLSGVISSTGTVTMAGASTLTLTGTNTYIGTTTVSAGSLTLLGNRTVAGGVVSIGNGGTSTLNIQGDLPFAGNNQMDVGVSSTGIVNHSAGTVTFNAGNTLELLIGRGSSGRGTYNLSGSGVLNIGASANRGIMLGVNSGTLTNPCVAAFNMTGGTINNAGVLMIVRSDSSAYSFNSSFTQSGGSASNAILVVGGNGTIGSNSTAVLTITGGTFMATTFSSLSSGYSVTSTITIAGTADVTLPAFPTVRGVGSTADIIFDGGILRPSAASPSYMSGLNSAKIKAGGATFDVGSGRDITIAQNLLPDLISTGGGLTKAGSGTLTLTGANTYTGPTLINAGTLFVNRTNTVASGTGTFTVKTNGTLGGNGMIDLSPVNQNVVIESGGKISPGSAASTVGTLTLALGSGSLDLSAAVGTAGTLVFDLGSTNASDKITLSSGTLNIGSGLLNFASFNFQTAAGFMNATSTYTLISSPGGITGTLAGGGLSGTLANGMTATIAINGNDVVVNVSGVEGVIVQPVTWKGNLSGSWDSALTNWVLTADGITAAYYADGDAVTFDDSAAGNTTISGIPVMPGSVIVSNTTKAYTLNSVITGTSALTKWGTNALTLSGSNTYSGGTTLNAGILNINTTGVAGVSGPLGNGGAFTINGGTINNAGGAAIALSNVNPIAVGGDFAFTGSSALGLPGTIDLGGTNRSIAVNSSALTLSGIISNGGLTKAGVGTLTLSGTNSYGGGTVLSAGTLSVSADNNFGATNTAITVNGNARINSTASVGPTYSRPISLSPGVTLTLQNPSSGSPTAATFSGAITGSGGITIVSAGVASGSPTIDLSSPSNNFTSNLTMPTSGNNDFLKFASIGDGGLITFGRSSWRSVVQYTGSANLILASRQIALGSTFGNILDGGGNPINDFGNIGSGTVTFTNNMSVAATITSGTFYFDGSNTNDNTFAGNIPSPATSGTLSIGKWGTGKWIISGNISINGSVNAQGGTFVLSGTNTYPGITNPDQNALTIQGKPALSPNTTIAFDQTSGSAGGGSGRLNLLMDDSGIVSLGNQVNLRTVQTSAAAQWTIFVGNKSGATTGSTLALGKMNFNSITDYRAAGATMNVQGTNGYNLLFNSVDLNWGQAGAQGFNPTTASLLITGNVQQVNGRPPTGTNIGSVVLGTTAQTFSLGGTASGNLISGTIKDANDFTDLSNTNALPLKLLKTGSSTWTLSGSNAFSGGLTLSGASVGSQLNINNPWALGSGTFTISGGNNAKFDNTSGAAITNANNNPMSWLNDFVFVGSQDLDLGTGAVSMGGNRGVTVSAGTLTVGGSISGNGLGITKAGNGRLILNGANTYSGTTTINFGTLFVNGVVGTNTVTVGTFGTLGGRGLCSGIVSNRGTVAPGTSPGTLTVGDSYVQATNGALAIEIGGTSPGTQYDVLVVSNSATIAGALNVTLTNGYTGVANDSFTILTASAVTGTFATTSLPALGGGNGWNVQYQSNSVILSVTNAGGPPSTGYDLAAQSITNPAQRGIQDDADGDGYPNLLEYVTGGNLTNADNIARMSATRMGGLLALQFTRTSNSVDTIIVVQGANSVTNEPDWTGIATNINGSWGSATNVIETNGPALFNVTAFDTSPSTNRFLRLRVTRP